jgi:transcriptional regulator with XRE-family HTH domain
MQHEKDIKLFGFRVKQYRESLKLDREAIAEKIDVHARTYAKWENGQSAPPLDKVFEIASVLGQPVAALLNTDLQIQNSFNNNTQEGEECVIQKHINISFDRDTMKELNERFVFLEQLLAEERAEKKALQEKLFSLL